MENNEKFQKINAGYLLLNIFGPILVVVLGMMLSMVLPDAPGLILCIAVYAFAVLWWAWLGRKYYDKIKAQTLKELEDTGFTSNHTFNADGCTVVVDLNHGKVAILFRWNPRKVYVRPASSLSNVHVDDGCHGKGFMAGSSCVSFLFHVDGVKIRVNTFTSNRRWQMNSSYITTGIEKAEAMVNSLIAAGAKA